MIPEARLATTLCLLAPAGDGMRVLMVRRSPAMRFMPGAWVFPGGVVDAGDDASADTVVPGADPEHRAWAAAAVRELFEETGIWLVRPPVVVPAAERAGADAAPVAATLGPVDGSGIVHLHTWVTPTMVPVRFHTRFSVAAVDGQVAGDPDGVEVDELAWVDPAEAVAAADAGARSIPLPTRSTLAGLASLGSVAAAMDAARRGPPTVVRPRLRAEGDILVALVPGDDGFEETPELPPDPDALGRVIAVRGVDGRPVPELGPPR